jgi:lipopolysaccharide/colanic/teichoic acid biosynthesis glycosyltransferase
MILRKVVRAVHHVLRPSRPAAGPVAPPEQVRVILERERARAERNGDPLALLTFAVAAGRWEPAPAAALARALRGRLRITDEVGWLDGRHLCAVLPGAAAEGAWRVLDDILASPGVARTRLVCTVYVYPAEGPGAGGAPGAVGRPVPGAGRPVAPLDALFLRPLPPWKRALDLGGAFAGLVLLAPLLAALAAAVRLTSRGPVFFRQWRTGRGGRPFVIYKFRTMVADAAGRQEELLALNERDGPAFKIRNDPRVTRLGRLLRATSLDELPQLWNVLKGDMSLVGPRPLPCHEAAACSRWQRRRLDAMPGLTCIWQVWGRGGVAFADWVRMDLRYIRSLSLWQDLKLLALTVPAVFLRRGAH